MGRTRSLSERIFSRKKSRTCMLRACSSAFCSLWSAILSAAIVLNRTYNGVLDQKVRCKYRSARVLLSSCVKSAVLARKLSEPAIKSGLGLVLGRTPRRCFAGCCTSASGEWLWRSSIVMEPVPGALMTFPSRRLCRPTTDFSSQSHTPLCTSSMISK